MLGLRERLQYSDQRSSQIRAPCVVSTAAGTEGEEDQMARLSNIKRTADGRKQRSREMIDEKREKYRTMNGSLWT